MTYTLQIYFDFGGYSNMAIGLGWATGFYYPRNFDYPYVSHSITEFWRRWHMSLSRWFRDYLYVPLGGNRHGPLATYRNLVVVFLLCGFWHGASWTFVLWGAYHGALLVVERLGLGRALDAAPRPARHLYAMLAVVFGWVIFRADGLAQIGHMVRLMVVPGPAKDLDVLYRLSTAEIAVVVLALLGLDPGPWRAWSAARRCCRPCRPGTRTAPPGPTGRAASSRWSCSLASAVKVLSGSYSPFIYFRF